MSRTYLAAVALALAVGGAPVMAPAQGTAPATGGAGPSDTKVVKSGRLEETHGGWRSSRLVGADVYDDHDKDIGTIDDLIVGKDGKIDTAVLSVGGFLGIGSKLVSVPYDQLKFQEHNDTEGTATPAATPGLGVPAPGAGGTGPGSATGTGSAAGTGSAPGTGSTAGGSMAANGTAAPPTTPAPGTMASGSATSAGSAPVAQPVTYKTTRIVLPGASVDSLKSMAEFTYQP